MYGLKCLILSETFQLAITSRKKIVDSPVGSLWLPDGLGHGAVVVQLFNSPIGDVTALNHMRSTKCLFYRISISGRQTIRFKAFRTLRSSSDIGTNFNRGTVSI